MNVVDGKFELDNTRLAARSCPGMNEKSTPLWAYSNPVSILFGAGSFNEVGALLGGRRYALITYPDPFFADLQARLAELAGPPSLVVDDVAPNPDFKLLAEQTSRFSALAEAPQAIVALGGGSVIDSAKVFAAAKGDFAGVRRFLETKTGSEALGATPVIAIPTTAGTGSEVTCWSTVWDAEGGAKHSLAHARLYPEYAVIDPKLMVTKPRDLTVSTGLDVLSHALESLWNKNANPVSMTFAVSAARETLEVLPRLVEDLTNVELRARMARAALFAGLAFSNTKTAIAHSLSYPITLRHGVAHGIACSFTLPMIVRSLDDDDGICRADICGQGLGAIFEGGLWDGADRLERFLRQLGVSTDPASYGLSGSEWEALVGAALDGERGQNFIGSREALMAVMLGCDAGMPNVPAQ
jgi:alcohol dehydrogenase